MGLVKQTGKGIWGHKTEEKADFEVEVMNVKNVREHWGKRACSTVRPQIIESRKVLPDLPLVYWNSASRTIKRWKDPFRVNFLRKSGRSIEEGSYLTKLRESITADLHVEDMS